MNQINVKVTETFFEQGNFYYTIVFSAKYCIIYTVYLYTQIISEGAVATKYTKTLLQDDYTQASGFQLADDN